MKVFSCIAGRGSTERIERPANQDISLKESAFHGNTAFPAAIYDDDLTVEEVLWHWHEEFEAGWITGGTISMDAESEHVTLKKGQGFFINSGVVHAFANADPGRPARLRSIVFHRSIAGGCVGSIYEQQYVIPVLHSQRIRALALKEGDQILTYLQKAWTAAETELPDYPLIVRNELSWVFASLSAEAADGEEDSGARLDAQRRERTQIMLEEIHSGYRENLTLEKIASAANISVSEALRCFHQLLGCTPIQYLKRYRLAHAAQMLRETTASVSEIYSSCGFSDGSYFSRSFRNMYRYSPAEYRKHMKTENSFEVGKPEVL